MRNLCLVLVILLNALPAFAQETTTVPAVYKEPSALLVMHENSGPGSDGYADKHPLITAPTRYTWKGVKKIGRFTRLNKIGIVFKKAGAAASDGFVAFGKATEKYHPGMQTIGYAGQFVTPWIVGFFK